MNCGGVETWLMHLLRRNNPSQCSLCFLVHTDKAAYYDEEIRRLGSKIIPCSFTNRPLEYSSRLHQLLQEHGPFDVVHSHVHHFSGLVLRVAKQAGVPVRIAHSHSDTRLVEKTANWRRMAYLQFMKWLIGRYATVGIGASERAALALFGPNWKSDPRWRILYCAVDLKPFLIRPDRVEVRAELGLPTDAFVIGHVGSFSRAKNHSFLLQIAAGVMRQSPKARLLLVGDGGLRGDIEAQSRLLGIADRVHFVGLRPDIPKLMMGAMDVFIFPSIYEGLPLAVIEAQAAGLPVLLSDRVTREVEIVPGAVQWLSISESPDKWVQHVMESPRTSIFSKALGIVTSSRFEISECLRELYSLYCPPREIQGHKVEHSI